MRRRPFLAVNGRRWNESTHRPCQRMDSLHICMISYFPPSEGPLSEYCFHLVTKLAACPRISKITILADKIDVECFVDESLKTGKVEVIRCWRMDELKTPFVILRNVRRVKPDLVYFNLIPRYFSSTRIKNFVGLCSPYITRILSIPIVITLHHTAEIDDLNSVGYKNSNINRIGLRLAIKIILKAADVITLTHPHFVDALVKSYNRKDNVVYLPHGTLIDPISYEDSKGKVLLFFGKVGKYKNLELTLESFRDLLKIHADAELTVAGVSNPFQPLLKESILERYKELPNIVTRGYVPENELQKLFTSSTAVLLPYSISTWSSGVFTLAAAFGRPVIASDLPDFRNLKEKEGAGIFLFPVNDKKALTESMNKLLSNKELQRTLGQANSRWARRNGLDEVAARLFEIFETINYKKKGPALQ
jgi:glycosyltransferase involved in cell wall biosynthesis